MLFKQSSYRHGEKKLCYVACYSRQNRSSRCALCVGQNSYLKVSICRRLCACQIRNSYFIISEEVMNALQLWCFKTNTTADVRYR